MDTRNIILLMFAATICASILQAVAREWIMGMTLPEATVTFIYDLLKVLIGVVVGGLGVSVAKNDKK